MKRTLILVKTTMQLTKILPTLSSKTDPMVRTVISGIQKDTHIQLGILKAGKVLYLFVLPSPMQTLRLLLKQQDLIEGNFSTLYQSVISENYVSVICFDVIFIFNQPKYIQSWKMYHVIEFSQSL